MYIYMYIYMVFTTEGFFKIATESWPEWDLNPRPQNSVIFILHNTLHTGFCYIYIYCIALTVDWKELNKETCSMYVCLQNNFKVYLCTQIETNKIAYINICSKIFT